VLALLNLLGVLTEFRWKSEKLLILRRIQISFKPSLKDDMNEGYKQPCS
jgi:hypothetical protein